MTIPALNIVDFLLGDSIDVARGLLGRELVSSAGGGVTTGGIIVETEAYHGLDDPASHAFRGKTDRTAPMFEAGGTLYVYLSMGIHNCLNIVTGPAGVGQAVLIRALEPTLGIERMIGRRGTDKLTNLASGPGKLTQALGVTRQLSGTRLGQTLSLREPNVPKPKVATSPRIGISKAVDYPWRFYVPDNPFVSRARLK
jgi:DNA-3-methyladenine glycosylase